jgi:hypothetical protein
MGRKYLPCRHPAYWCLGVFSVTSGAFPFWDKFVGLVSGKKTLQKVVSLAIIVSEEVRIMKKSCCETKQSNSVIDVAKFFMAIGVVALHCQVDLAALNVFYKLAVPLFFMFSSYFLFGKLSSAKNREESSRAIKAFVVRNLKLYTFWLAIQLPLLISYQSFDTSVNVVVGLLMFIAGNPLFAIIALIAGIGMIINHFSKKKKVEQGRENVKKQFEEKRSTGIQIIRATLAEVVDFRAEFDRKDAESQKVTDFLEQISPDQYVRKLADSGRKIKV